MAIFPFLFTRKADVAPLGAGVEVDSDVGRGNETDKVSRHQGAATVEDILGRPLNEPSPVVLHSMNSDDLRNVWMHNNTKGTNRRRGGR